ncbi:MAG: PASTA domain-containing protein, partial [Solirubrobacterales bacterium]|nr:PASTA domain-containing protein [Solirubrobacterales bacterium]
RTTLQNAGFAVSVINVTNSNPAGVVIAQDPQGDTKADEGSTVSLTVSQGPGNATVPSVEGLSVAQAKQAITRAGLKPGRVVLFSSTQFNAGQVTGTDPAAGQSIPAGTAVTIFESSGKPQIAVPDVTGDTEANARTVLEADHFNVATSTQTSSTVPAGNVISQSPTGGSQATQGSTVALVIATAPPTASVPNVTGQTADAASGTLTAAGFKVNQQTTNVNQQSSDGKVVSQNPGAGTTANKGSTVTITVGKFTPPTTTTTTPTTSTPTTTKPKKTKTTPTPTTTPTTPTTP